MHLPTLNATLNGGSAVFILIGWFLIRRKKVSLHGLSMTTAFFLSALFLVSYLYYHAHHGSTPFQGTGAVRSVYFTVLISHTVLATVNLPLILFTFVLGLQRKIDRHRRLAKIAFPIWLYVSVSGVVIYWMLYMLSY